MVNEDAYESKLDDNNSALQHKEIDVNDHQKTFTLESILSSIFIF